MLRIEVEESGAVVVKVERDRLVLAFGDSSSVHFWRFPAAEIKRSGVRSGDAIRVKRVFEIITPADEA